MIENYLNKEAKIQIAFSSWGSGGSAPHTIVGKITNIDKDFVNIELDPTHKDNKIRFKNTSGKMLLKKEYLISVVLL